MVFGNVTLSYTYRHVLWTTTFSLFIRGYKSFVNFCAGFCERKLLLRWLFHTNYSVCSFVNTIMEIVSSFYEFFLLFFFNTRFALHSFSCNDLCICILLISWLLYWNIILNFYEIRERCGRCLVCIPCYL